jgi:N-acetylgalactosamine-N,N'-diacetylbacillosaminyl-diphospho-undecaprenol 4-alpha-N-acetylgalactosaminyltransferase
MHYDLDVILRLVFMNYNKPPICLFGISLDKGGAEKLLVNLASLFREERKVVLYLLNDIIRYPIPEGVEVVLLSKGKRNKYALMNILLIPYYAFLLSKQLRARNITTIVSFLERPNYISNCAKLFNRKLIIINGIHTFLSRYYLPKTFHGIIGRFLVRLFYPLADAIVVCSKHIRYDLIKTYKIKSKKVNTIYNAIEPPIGITPKTFAEQKFTFIHIGSYYPVKNHMLLVEAFAQMPHFEECRLVLVGKGELEQKIREYVAQLGLTDYVQFVHGYDTDVFEYLAAADCFVLSSLFEGFPVVLVEALHFNLPIISTDCRSGPREIIAPDTPFSKELTTKWEITPHGILTPVGNAEKFAEAMYHIYKNPELHVSLKNNAVKRVRELSLEQYKMDYFRAVEKAESSAR